MSLKPTHPLSGSGSGLYGVDVIVPGSFQSGRRPGEVAWLSPGAAPIGRRLTKPPASCCAVLGGPATGVQDWKGVPPVSRGGLRQGCPSSVPLARKVPTTSARARHCGALATQVAARRGRRARVRCRSLGEPLGTDSVLSSFYSSRCGECCSNNRKDLAKWEREPGKTPKRGVMRSLSPNGHQPSSWPCLSQRGGGHSFI